MKKILVIVLGVALYIWWMVHGYFAPQRAGRMIATALIYIMMHYVTLSWRDTAHKYGWIVRIFITVMTFTVLITTGNIWLWLSVLLWHAALRSVIHSLEEILTNRRKFRLKEFFQAGGALFSIFFTLSFITAFMGRNEQFTLTCDDIYEASFKVVNYTEEKFNVGFEQIHDRQRGILGDIFINSGDTQVMTTGNANMKELGLSGYDTESFAWLIQSYKQQLIDETIANQKDVNQKVCQVFIDQIKELYTKPGFRVSVILLMFLVISPLLRLTLFIVSGINMLIFLLLKKMNVYKVQKESVEIDKII